MCWQSILLKAICLSCSLCFWLITKFESHLLTPKCCHFITFACNCPPVDLLNVKCSSHSESKWRFSLVVTRWSWCRSLGVFNLEDWRPENCSAEVSAARRGGTFFLFVSRPPGNLFEGNESNMLLQKGTTFPQSFCYQISSAPITACSKDSDFIVPKTCGPTSGVSFDPWPSK